MHWYNKKGQSTQWDMILAAVIGLVFLALFVGIVIVLNSGVLTQESTTQTACWLTNSIKCSGGVFSAMPSLCNLDTVALPNDPKDATLAEAKLASLVRETWWMYKENTCDFGNSADEVYPVYAFTSKEDISIPEYMGYTLTHNSAAGTNPVNAEKSDYAYLETNTAGQTICFDKSNKDSAIANLKLEGGKVYYIMYYDDQPIKQNGDKILITDNPDFKTISWKNIAEGTAVAAGAVVIIAATGGAAIAVYTGGISGISAITAGTELAIGLIGTKVAVITAAGVAAGSGSLYISSADENTDCIAYGPGSP